jgi:hypothetical protein
LEKGRALEPVFGRAFGRALEPVFKSKKIKEEGKFTR